MKRLISIIASFCLVGVLWIGVTAAEDRIQITPENQELVLGSWSNGSWSMKSYSGRAEVSIRKQDQDNFLAYFALYDTGMGVKKFELLGRVENGILKFVTSGSTTWLWLNSRSELGGEYELTTGSNPAGEKGSYLFKR